MQGTPNNPSGFIFSKRSMSNLAGTHKDLQKVIYEALRTSPVDFLVYNGLRTLEEQKTLVATGKSPTMRSRHLTGHAIDLAPITSSGNIEWGDIATFDALGTHIKATAKRLGIKIKWGGDWKSKDRPHYQLNWKAYPIDGPEPNTAPLPKPDLPTATPAPQNEPEGFLARMKALTRRYAF
ncbi:MAG: M15 family peptidase [Rhodobacteraceae bacterium]|nr:M15 family peptidase [Paracoccaceae bacterium]